MNEAEVFAAYEATVYIEEQISKTDSFTTSGSNYILNNSGNGIDFPHITITANEALTLTNINNNSEQQVNIGLSLSNGDIITLDFDKQQYELNSSDIIGNLSFVDNTRIFLEADKDNTFSFSVDGSIDVDIQYYGYESSIRETYVRNFSITVDNDYNNLKPFNQKKLINKKQEEVIYNFSIGRLSVNWDLYDSINSNDFYRIRYNENHSSLIKNYDKYLVGATFESYSRGFDGNAGLVITDASGEGMNLL